MSSFDPRENTHRQSEGLTYFALIGSQRCGSNFLRELMNTNPRTVVHGEVFMPFPLPNCYHSYLRTMVSRAMPPVYAADCLELFDEYLVYLREDVKRGYIGKLGVLAAVGLDIKYNQIRFVAPLIRDLRQRPFLLDYFWRRNTPVLHLVRRNTIHQALSLTIATARDVYHNYSGAAFEGKVKLDPDAVVKSAQWIAAETAEFQRLAKGLRCLDITYEDVVADCATGDENGRLSQSGVVLPKIAEFLSVPNEFYVPTTIAKVVNRPYSEIIENHDEVVAAIEQSEFAPLATTV